MALNFFKQRDIDEMDIYDIPEEFVNYFETLDDAGKTVLVGTRPDLAKALGFALPPEENEEIIDSMEEDSNIQDMSVSANNNDLLEGVDITDEPEEEDEELSLIEQNYYAGKPLGEFIKNNMEPLEVLAIPDNVEKCLLHREAFVEKQIKYTNNGAIYGVVLKVCKKCNRIFLEESSMEYIHDALVKRGVTHTFYNLELSNRYLRNQITAYELESEEKIYIPETWVEENPLCPIHDEELYELPCVRYHKDRKVEFTGYLCEKCNKIMIRSAAAADLEDECAANGIPLIEYRTLAKKTSKKRPMPSKEIIPDYIIENGKREVYKYTYSANCFKLTEEDTVVISDSIYCNLENHDTEEVLTLVWVTQKRGGRKSYIFVMGYCAQCQKYYMDLDDYKAVYSIGRPEITLISDINDDDYQVTSGDVFNLERAHLDKIEAEIHEEIVSIHDSSDYINPYAVGDYDDGNLSFAKALSQNRYGKRLEELENYISKPYSYRVDITADSKTETYYIGATDVVLGNGKKVISANSDLGYELINYQTIKVHKDGKEYDIKLSRQFDIDNATLYGYTNLRTDEDKIFQSGITDPFLVRVLNMRKRQHNLTDIFVTIQENQNKIVNADFNKNIVVQGCAGSGKTMVLLHRLSSLKYKYRYFDFTKNALILTPNDQFSLHIKGLAEGLQIGNIQRMSVEQYYIDILMQYDSIFKPENKVVSEMVVRQEFVDYIYSDQFRTDFDRAYEKVISERNALVGSLNILAEAMEEPVRNISLEDEAKVYDQMRFAADALNERIRQKEQNLLAAKENWDKEKNRKIFLEEKISSSQNFVKNIVQETASRVNIKIFDYLSEKQSNIDFLNEQLKRLTDERKQVQASFIMFGKRVRLDKLDTAVKVIEQKIVLAQNQMEAEKEILLISQMGKEDDETIAWMRQVAHYIKEVKEEIRLCKTAKEELIRFSKELQGMDERIESAQVKYETAVSEDYSEEIKKTIDSLYQRIDGYTLMKTFQQIFDNAVAEFKAENKIKNITGKCHRYDLYAQLLFVMKFFKTVPGDIHFICVDEGQDLTFNEYCLLYELNRRTVTFNIFGDTNQLMKPGRGISDWEPLLSRFDAVQFILNENYRNTNQITRFCNSSFGMSTLQTGVDGAKVREIPRRDLEKELVDMKITTERVAVLVPRGVQKTKYLDMEILPQTMQDIIGEKMDNGFIAIMYVDEVKGIEFDRVFVVSNKMSRNEKYIAYTRALSELIIVVDDQVQEYNDGSNLKKKTSHKNESKVQKKSKKLGILKWDKNKTQIADGKVDSQQLTFELDAKAVIKHDEKNSIAVIETPSSKKKLIHHSSCLYKEHGSKCYNINCTEMIGKRCHLYEECLFYLAADTKLLDWDKREIKEDIEKAKIYLRNIEDEKHRGEIPRVFSGIKEIPLNQIEIPYRFKGTTPDQKKITRLMNYYQETGHMDKPISVCVKDQRYVLQDKYLRYCVAKLLKLNKVEAICVEKIE